MIESVMPTAQMRRRCRWGRRRPPRPGPEPPAAECQSRARRRRAQAAAAMPTPANTIAPGSGTITSWPDVALNSSVWPPAVAAAAPESVELPVTLSVPPPRFAATVPYLGACQPPLPDAPRAGGAPRRRAGGARRTTPDVVTSLTALLPTLAAARPRPCRPANTDWFLDTQREACPTSGQSAQCAWRD